VRRRVDASREAPQHSAGHHGVRRNDQEMSAEREPPRRGAGAPAEDEAGGASTVDRRQSEAPGPVQPGHAPSAPRERQVRRGLQKQMVGIGHLTDDEPAFGLGRSVGNEVTDPECLEVVQDPVRARAIGREEQGVDPARGVPASSMPADLDKPRPNLLGRCPQCRRVRRSDLRVADESIAGHGIAAFGGVGAGGATKPLHRREACGDRGEYDGARTTGGHVASVRPDSAHRWADGPSGCLDDVDLHTVEDGLVPIAMPHSSTLSLGDPARPCTLG